MAPERTPGPGGFDLPGRRRFTEDDAPSRAEVQQRIHSLYDRAETDSGTFNATRAVATGTQRRANPVLDRDRRRADPALDDVARQWFESARLRLGPTVPAALPRDRMPDRPSAGRPSEPASLPVSDLVVLLRELGLADRPDRELTAGPAARPVAELTAAAVAEPAARPVAELTAGPTAELTAGPVAALPAAPERLPEIPQVMPGLATEPESSVPETAKEHTRQRLSAARDLLAQRSARHGTATPAVEPPPATDAWRPTEGQNGLAVQEAWQQPAGLGMDFPAVSPGTGLSATVPAAALTPDPLTDPQFATGTTPFPAAPQTFPTMEPWPAAVGQLPTLEPFLPTLEPFLAAPQPFPTTEPLPAAPQLPVPEPFPATPQPFLTAEPLPVAEALPGAGLPLGMSAAQEPGYDTKYAKAVAFARAQLGRPCLWGAAGPESYDAAGLTQAAWRAAGVTLPRAARDQSVVGTLVPLTDVQPGDLVFYHPDAGHVGLCSGNGMMIHAPGPGAFIREEAVLYAGEAAIHSVLRPA
ncbi:C40 family peptidase [Streptomyces gibsoniae]|uniref:NlpC/P60 family protein n=1 Tax=Streptomyces gibsoniae TaxID=3075529 RepID=A0ABU2TZ04_9ACTN|nr:NlpC/P60 family protein [Streptomyces sp. DSM 41699]MDT0466204.1 NlpC/P60 family protein [Streptomyces sp. DSM 41699]